MVQRVKYLYLDDEGRLMADLEGGQSIVIALREAFPSQPFYGFNPRGSNPPAEFDEIPLLPSYHLSAKLSSPLPTPSAEWEGVTATHRDDGKTEVLICVKNTQGEYEWIEIGEST